MRVWPTVAAWGVFVVVAIVAAGLALGGIGAGIVAVVIIGSVVGTTDVWGRVQTAERTRRPARTRIEV